VLSVRHNPWQVSSIGDDIPGESHCYVFVVDQPIAIVPEVVLGVHAAIVEHGIFAPENNLVPQNNLVQFVVGRLIFSGEIKEQLFHVPVEEGIEIGLEVESEKPQIILLLASGIVWHILHHHLHCVDIGVHLVFIEEG